MPCDQQMDKHVPKSGAGTRAMHRNLVVSLVLTISNLACPVQCSMSVAFLGSELSLVHESWKRPSAICSNSCPYSRHSRYVQFRMAVSGGGEKRGVGGTRKEPRGEEIAVERMGKVEATRQRKGEATGIRGSVKTQGKKWDNITPVPPSIRVASGTAKGRKLTTPDVYLRPMMGKVRRFDVTSLCTLNGGDARR